MTYPILQVNIASPTTFNVRGGDYLYKGTVKTYTPGSAIDPTDSDTTYVWMNPDNTISSAIDGTGWPTTEHIKLAEIDVDSDGVITAVRDKRGRKFMQWSDPVTEVADAILTYEGEVLTYDGDVLTYQE